MEQGIITLTDVFKDLERMGESQIFRVDGDEVIFSNSRGKLIFLDNFFVGDHQFSSLSILAVPKVELSRSIKNNFGQFPEKFVFIYNPTYYDGGSLRYSNNTALIKFSQQFGKDTRICIQQDDREFPPRSSFLISTEELGELITMLYFRENGYIVQKPLHTYGREGNNKPGVDDVAAWKSPVINKLRKRGFVGKGCHISELACLRWLGRLSSSSSEIEDQITKELILVEVKHSRADAISNSPSKGINQLLRAKKENVAGKLFICFPFHNKNVESIRADIMNAMPEGPVVGSILFSDKGLHVNDSQVFPHQEMSSAIDEYENNLKKFLLNNFYFDEIVEMIRELGLDTTGKGCEEVLQAIRSEIYKMPIDWLLDKLEDVLS